MARAMSRHSPDDLRRAAESARSVLARASSAELTWLDPEGPRPGGTVCGVVLADGEWAHDGPAAVEVADPAPLAVPDRIRARVRLHGYAAPDADRPGFVRMRVQGAELERGGVTTWLSAGQLRAAQVDPLAHREAALLGHLATSHWELIESLAGLAVSPAPTVRVTPLALDRHGFTFRVATDAGHRDVELAFPSPATSVGEIRCRVQALATAAAAARRRTSKQRPGGLADLLRFGPAASRLCSPHDGSGQ